MISVCIPTYNGEKYLEEQLNSILCQLGEDDEIIISDDSSTDSTINIIESYKDNRIRVLYRNNYKSTIFNLENALRSAKGDYIFMADQDDIWRGDKIEVMVRHLQKYDLVLSDAVVVNKQGEELLTSFFEHHNSRKGYWHNLRRNSYVGCCMAFRKECLMYVLPFPKKIAMHDIWIGLCVELCGETLFLQDRLIYFRRHDNNSSSTGGKSRLSLMKQLNYRIYLLIMTITRMVALKR